MCAERVGGWGWAGWLGLLEQGHMAQDILGYPCAREVEQFKAEAERRNAAAEAAKAKAS